MNVVAVSANNYSNRVNFEANKNKGSNIINTTPSEQNKKPISKFTQRWRETYRCLAIAISFTLGMCGLAFLYGKKSMDAQKYIKQTDYDKYIELCDKDSLMHGWLPWITNAHKLKVSQKAQEDSLRIYYEGFNRGFEEAMKEKH